MDTSKPITYEQISGASAADIASLTTRHIKALHDRWRLENQLIWHYVYDDSDLEPSSDVAMLRKAVAKLKAELDTRPHVPNKQEAKALRREAAKRGR